MIHGLPIQARFQGWYNLDHVCISIFFRNQLFMNLFQTQSVGRTPKYEYTPAQLTLQQRPWSAGRAFPKTSNLIQLVLYICSFICIHTPAVHVRPFCHFCVQNVLAKTSISLACKFCNCQERQMRVTLGRLLYYDHMTAVCLSCLLSVICHIDTVFYLLILKCSDTLSNVSTGILGKCCSILSRTIVTLSLKFWECNI